MIKSFYLKNSVYYISFVAVVLFILSYFLPLLFTIAVAVLICLGIAILTDIVLLYHKNSGISAHRSLTERFSNGDENKITIHLKNEYGFKLQCLIIDELPYQFQSRNWYRTLFINAYEKNFLDYFLKPLERGAYHFGNINIYLTSPLKIIMRRYTFKQQQEVKVYPAFIQMRRYELMAIADNIRDAGSKRIRKLGHSIEFEQIKEYVRGDDYRTINWQATSRRGDLMVNNFTDERSQQIYCIINKGRNMKMPFDGMTLLDYAINATLVLSKIALTKHDKAGLITFAEEMDAFIPADKKPRQMNVFLEELYKLKTRFLEPDFEGLFSLIRTKIPHRSLLILFTNFESYESFQRELTFLKHIARHHLLMVVFFENTEVKKMSDLKAATMEDVYIKTIADKYLYEKKLIAKELQKAGIIALLTPPQKLTIATINKYLELKQKQSI